MEQDEERVFSVISEISKELNCPYASESETRFLFEKNNCYHEVTIGGNRIEVVAWLGGVDLQLDLDMFGRLCSRIRGLPSARSGSIPTPRLEIIIRKTRKELVEVFPRHRFGTVPLLIANRIRESQNLLCEIGTVFEEFRVHDKSYESLQKLWKEIGTIESKTRKGKKLEELLSLLVSRDEDFNIVERNIRTRSEEIDIVIENVGKTAFYSQLRSPLILLECKNWVSKIRAKDVRDFAQKVQNRPRVVCNIGVLISTSNLTKDATEELVGYRGKDFLIVTLNKLDIDETINKRLDFGEIMKTKLREAGLR